MLELLAGKTEGDKGEIERRKGKGKRIEAKEDKSM